MSQIFKTVKTIEIRPVNQTEVCGNGPAIRADPAAAELAESAESAKVFLSELSLLDLLSVRGHEC